jgi:hypothetical protein
VALRCETLAVIARRGPTGIESEHFEIPFDAPPPVADRRWPLNDVDRMPPCSGKA